MLRVTADVDAPDWQAQAVKEALAMELERYGDTRIVDVRGVSPTAQQTRMPFFAGAYSGAGR